MPRYVVNLGATLEWENLSIGIHELFYGKTFDYDNDGGATNGTIMFYKNEISPAAITNLEVSFKATEMVTLKLGATNLFDEYPDKRNATHREVQFGGNDNSAVAQYPAFSPFGINGGYYYGSISFRF